jgi:hypothetical protein
MQNEQYKKELDAEEKRPFWARGLDDRQWGLVQHCRSYVNEGSHGLPGHQLMLIIDYMADELALADITPDTAECRQLCCWLDQTFGAIVQGDTVTERVLSVVRHYINQMGRWLSEKEEE